MSVNFKGDIGFPPARLGGFRLTLTPLFDGPTADGTPSDAGGGTPAPVAAPSGGSPAAATPASGTPAGQPGGQSAAAARRFEYQEDRSNWVPPHRIRESSQRLQQMERELHYERQRVAALSGVQPPQAPVSREEQEIRQQLEQLYPGLGKLGGMMEKLERLAQMDPQDITGAQTHYWESIGHQTLSRLDDEVAELVGGELSPFQRQAMRSAFGAWIQSDQTLGARYAQMDPKLVKDFIKEYQQGFVDPVRRSFTTQQAPRQERAARLPRGGNSSAIPGGGPAPIQPADTDEFHGAAFRALTQSRQ